MAVTITRTPWVDDDGTGTTGTVINNAVKTTLYNEIDAALAKVAQLAGGNTFPSGNQTFAGQLSASSVIVNAASNTGVSQVFVIADLASVRGITIQNSNASSSGAYLYFVNNTGAPAGSISQTGAGTVAFNTSSDARLKRDAGRASDVSSLRGVVVHDFTWTADGVRDRGVFAQDAHALYPRAVTVGDDDRTADGSLAHPWMTDYSKFVPDLIVGWQQHDAALAELRALLATVKG